MAAEQLLLKGDRVATAFKKHSKSDKVINVHFEDGTKAMASVTKHFNGDKPRFLDEENKLLPGWSIQNGWLTDPEVVGGLTPE